MGLGAPQERNRTGHRSAAAAWRSPRSGFSERHARRTASRSWGRRKQWRGCDRGAVAPAPVGRACRARGRREPPACRVASGDDLGQGANRRHRRIDSRRDGGHELLRAGRQQHDLVALRQVAVQQPPCRRKDVLGDRRADGCDHLEKGCRLAPSAAFKSDTRSRSIAADRRPRAANTASRTRCPPRAPCGRRCRPRRASAPTAPGWSRAPSFGPCRTERDVWPVWRSSEGATLSRHQPSPPSVPGPFVGPATGRRHWCEPWAIGRAARRHRRPRDSRGRRRELCPLRGRLARRGPESSVRAGVFDETLPLSRGGGACLFRLACG